MWSGTLGLNVYTHRSRILNTNDVTVGVGEGVVRISQTLLTTWVMNINRELESTDCSETCLKGNRVDA